MNFDFVIQAEFGITFAKITPGYGTNRIGCIYSTFGKEMLEIIAIESQKMILMLEHIVRITKNMDLQIFKDIQK